VATSEANIHNFESIATDLNLTRSLKIEGKKNRLKQPLVI